MFANLLGVWHNIFDTNGEDKMRKTLFAGIVGFVLFGLSSCAYDLKSELSSALYMVDSQTVKDMPKAYLCGLLGPDSITMPSERRAVYTELEARGEECIASERLVIENK
tara:strand:+ start:1470 stop:1796 length:327 start_codon:yes stop_codon:yes gene_type:complete